MLERLSEEYTSVGCRSLSLRDQSQRLSYAVSIPTDQYVCMMSP
jgi:hypothetical protein